MSAATRLIYFASLATALAAPPADAEFIATDHLRSALVAESTAAVPGQTIRLGLLLEHDPHWHTYWRNPGDAGMPTRIEIEAPAGVAVGALQWPAPQRFEVGGIVNFGYAGRTLLPVTLTIPEHVGPGPLIVRARASWLVCEEECIPGRAEYRLALPLAAASEADARWREDFVALSSALPQPLPVQARYRIDGQQLRFEFPAGSLPAGFAAWEWFPTQPQLIDHAGAPTWALTDGGLRASLPLSPYFASAPDTAEIVLVHEDGAWSFSAQHAPAN